MNLVNRRKWMRQSVLGLMSLRISLGINACKNKKGQRPNELYNRFVDPVAEAKPFFRWWWNGNRVNAKEAIRQLRLMHTVGSGGVEINPIEMHHTAINPDGDALEWLSEAWNKVLKEVVVETRVIGMIPDLIVGTGWPFGGKFIPKEEWLQGLEVNRLEISGKSFLKEHLLEKDEIKGIVHQVLMFEKGFRHFNDAIDLSGNVDDQGILEFQIPEGDFELYITIWKNGFREVLHGAPGGDGPVLDHFNASAVSRYLQHMSEKLKPHFNDNLGSVIRAVFCDSIELSGANWTGDLTMEFEKRRGYTIGSYLPFVIDMSLEVHPLLEAEIHQVRYDYSLTLSELFYERFLIPYHDWCHSNQLLSRYQAYGFPWIYTDMIDGYMVPDIPESDQWLFNRGWIQTAVIDDIRYAIWNKYASSGAHLAGKRIVSCEAMTNTSGVFAATLEYIKQATDINIICGINHFVFHGFNYSPPEAAFPGWIRFGTYFHEQNTWWPYLHYYMTYASRLCQIMQDADPVSQIAILGPTPDVWRNHGLDRNPFNLSPWYLHHMWQALNMYGYQSDYINGHILQGAHFTNGQLHFGPMSYQLVVICEVSSLSIETAKAVQKYLEQEGKVLIIGDPPHQIPGKNMRHSTEQVRAIFHKIITSPLVNVLEAPPTEHFEEWVGNQINKLLEPAIKISQPNKRFFHLRKKIGDREIYFFCNSSREEVLETRIEFSKTHLKPVVWNAMNGEKSALPYKGNAANIKLDPLQSLLILFEEAVPEEIYHSNFRKKEKVSTLTGPWEVEFSPVREAPFKRHFSKLTDFADDDQLNRFAGSATYTIQWNNTGRMDRDFILDMGVVKDISEVAINGETIGQVWWGKHQYRVPKTLIKETGNVLEIKVTNLLFNYILSLENENPVAKFWMDRSRNRLARDGKIVEPVSAGLLGPVEVWRTG